MNKFRKKPVVVEAEQFIRHEYGWPDIAGVKFGQWHPVRTAEGMKQTPLIDTAYIETIEGKLHVSPGDWIITGVRGERYPCKPDIFARTYEPADAESEAARIRREEVEPLLQALRDLYEQVESLDDVQFTRDIDPHKAETNWNDAVLRARALLARYGGKP